MGIDALIEPVARDLVSIMKIKQGLLNEIFVTLNRDSDGGEAPTYNV
jgi:hypothetical protein